MSPQRIQRKRTKGWKMPENTVYVGRPGKWGNPIPASEPFTATIATRMFRDLVLNGEAWWTEFEGTRWESHNRFVSTRNPVPDESMVRAELAGKNLACWCPESQPCHADVLLELANR